MKVLHVYRTYFPDTQGGAEEVVRQICRNTKGLGIESRVFYPSSNPYPACIDAEEAQLIRVKKNFEIASCGFCLGGIGEFQNQVDWADIVHYHFPWPFADFMHLVTNVRRPSIVTYHSDIVRQRFLGALYEPLMKQFLGSMKRIVATSQNYVNSSNTLASHRDRVSVVPIGIDESSYPTPTKADLKRVGEVHGRDFFLFVGVWRYYKGLEFLLKAMKNKPYQAVIVGAGPEENHVRRLVSELGLENVSMTGYVDDITKMSLLKLCRAFVLPSHLRSEAFGVTLLESAMSGKPMISTEIGTGTSFINKDGETGFVVEPGEPAALAKAMDDLSERPEETTKMGVNARLRFESTFTGKLMGEKYAATYRSLMDGDNAA
ncbi:MAG: glycosyltransferase [Pseudomonadales bacterium]|nr:glycosyltransferase [Pseudomonadales bacterium]MBO6596127.1 glycosyltransferase [Pseudomonadales bacterium]MBO6822609.1 glycosyltransferase [Pseudomonadales bacterium]